MQTTRRGSRRIRLVELSPIQPAAAPAAIRSYTSAVARLGKVRASANAVPMTATTAPIVYPGCSFSQHIQSDQNCALKGFGSVSPRHSSRYSAFLKSAATCRQDRKGSGSGTGSFGYPQYAQHSAGSCKAVFVAVRQTGVFVAPFTAMDAASTSLRRAAARKPLRFTVMYQSATSALVARSSASAGRSSTSRPRYLAYAV